MHMLPVVIYVTYGNVSKRGPLEIIQMGSPQVLVPLTFYESYEWFRHKGNICIEVHPCNGNGILLAI